ncbi:MAG: glycosyltransferase family 2 protein [Paracoccaceae bacterium]
MPDASNSLKVAVITPYYKETDKTLMTCLESVAAQTAPCDHFMVSDGFPNAVVEKSGITHIRLPRAHADNGNTPRVLGGISAFNLGYDAIAFLDADNWFEPAHVATMLALHHQTGAAVCTSNRFMHRGDGSFMFVDDKNDGNTHVDTSCFFLTAVCRPVLAKWSMMPRQLGPICDTIYLGSIKQHRLSLAHDATPTVRFRTTYEADFRRLGEPMPPDVKTLEMTMETIRWYKSLPLAQRRQIRRQIGWPQGGLEPLQRRFEQLRRRFLATSGEPAGTRAA